MTIALASHPKVKLTVEQFDLLAEEGSLAGLERTELLDGDIYLMSPQYNRHSRAKSLFYDALLDWKRIHRPEWAVRTETSVAMPPNDEPIPDVILCDEPEGTKGIAVGLVHLLIEISDGSADYDVGYKAPLYARQGVPEYWVVDLIETIIVRHADPGPDGYADEREFRFGDSVLALTLDGLEVETGQLLG